jgi:hypothetical protein
VTSTTTTTTTTTTTPRAAAVAAPVAGVRVQRFAGALNGWCDASPAVVDAATAARRLRLYRAVRGDAFIYRVSGPVLPGESAAPVLPRHGDAAPVLPVLPARRNATPWHARTVPFAAVYALFALTFAAGAGLTARQLDAAAPSTNAQTVRVALR